MDERWHWKEKRFDLMRANEIESHVNDVFVGFDCRFPVLRLLTLLPSTFQHGYRILCDLMYSIRENGAFHFEIAYACGSSKGDP